MAKRTTKRKEDTRMMQRVAVLALASDRSSKVGQQVHV